MGVLQKALEESFRDLPRAVVRKVVEEKVAEHGAVDADIIDCVVAAILDREDDSDEVEIDLPFDLEFTEDDIAKMERSVEGLMEGIPDLVEMMGKDFGRGLADDCRERWSSHSEVIATEREAMRAKIAANWGDAFSDLRMLIELCAGYGDEFNRTHLKARRKRDQVRNHVLSRLHIRACRVAEEIALLLENGYAEGAEARWRTLLEVSVTMHLIALGGDTLAQRYLDYEVIDARKMVDDHDRALGAGSKAEIRISAADRKELDADHARAIRKYGKAFQGMYGWASGQVGICDQPQFHHLQEVAGNLSMKLQYRLACFGVHASPRKLVQPMHQWDPTIHVPGLFSAGFENAGTNTAYTLVQATLALFGKEWDLDELVELRVLSFVRDDVAMKMGATTQRIEREEQLAIDRALRRPQRRAPTSRFRR